MLRKAISGCALQCPWRTIPSRFSSSSTTTTVSSAVDSFLLRSLKDHYQEVAKMNPPPKVGPPSPFTIVKGALESNGPVLQRSYDNEEINLYVMRLATYHDDDALDQLFLHVDVSKPGQKNSLQFLCGLYPDALGIHSVAMRPKLETNAHLLSVPARYNGPAFGDLDENMRDEFHNFIEDRGINADLFPFLQAWLYVKENRNLMRWFRSVGQFINEQKSAKGAKH